MLSSVHGTSKCQLLINPAFNVSAVGATVERLKRYLGIHIFHIGLLLKIQEAIVAPVEEVEEHCRALCRYLRPIVRCSYDELLPKLMEIRTDYVRITNGMDYKNADASHQPIDFAIYFVQNNLYPNIILIGQGYQTPFGVPKYTMVHYFMGGFMAKVNELEFPVYVVNQLYSVDHLFSTGASSSSDIFLLGAPIFPTFERNQSNQRLEQLRTTLVKEITSLVQSSGSQTALPGNRNSDFITTASKLN